MSWTTLISPINHDFRIKDGNIVTVSDGDAVQVRLLVLLEIALGEWYLNTTLGIPYYGEDGVLGAKPNNSEISAIFRRAILKDPDVLRITFFSLSRTNSLTRAFSIRVDCLVQSDNGLTDLVSLEI